MGSCDWVWFIKGKWIKNGHVSVLSWSWKSHVRGRYIVTRFSFSFTFFFL
ncbi:hypothetical protein Hanom_Chr09g00767291 [Helianthus anomalus]